MSNVRAQIDIHGPIEATVKRWTGDTTQGVSVQLDDARIVFYREAFCLAEQLADAIKHVTGAAEDEEITVPIDDQSKGR